MARSFSASDLPASSRERKVLLETSMQRVEYDASLAMVRIRRLSDEWPPIEQIEREVAQVVAALRGVDRGRTRLLLELNGGLLPNDTEFESHIARLRSRVSEGFARVAVVRTSAIGRLQSARVARESQRTLGIFETESEAVAYLLRDS